MKAKKEFLIKEGYEPVPGTDILFGKYGEVENISAEETLAELKKRVKARETAEAAKAQEAEKEEEREEQEEEPIDMSSVNMTIESEQYVFLDKMMDETPTPVIRRVMSDKIRMYYEEKDGEIILYSSGTTIIKNGFVDMYGMLEAWKTKERLMGHDPDLYAERRAALGTCMHYLYGLYLTGEEIAMTPSCIAGLLDEGGLRIPASLMQYVKDNYIFELMEDIVSFAIFVHERNVKPLAIEKVLRSKEYMVASPIDLLCEMDDTVEGYFGETYKTDGKTAKKGDPKLSKRMERVVAIVDFKSNRTSGFWAENALQLGLYRKLVEENYPEVKIDRLYNFSPKDPAKRSASSPDYYLKDQTNNSELRKLECVLQQGKINHEHASKTVTYYRGTLKMGEHKGFDSYIKKEDLKKILNKLKHHA